MSKIRVLKLDLEGQVTWQYEGDVIERSSKHVFLEAYFDREDASLYGLDLKRGDRFVETFYTDRWYNIFEIYDRDDKTLKGWYCNIGFPAVLEPDSVSYVDLALDLLVFKDGRQLVLDEDEFNLLPLSEEDRQKARAALETLKDYFKNNQKGQAG